ncbi:MAG: hypothetical protein R3E84_14905 [Pseudomonadales bacterium]
MFELRTFPYPYRAMLAICSDLDDTPDLATYLTISRYLNTTEMTAIGTGLGLETGNTIYFHMAPGEFSYWNTDEAGRDALHALMRSGHIDCFHSYGDLAVRREQAGVCLEALAANDCHPTIWVDHAVAPTNFGPDIMFGRGDIAGDPAYHADLTLAAGVRYVWTGRVTSCLGQEVTYSPWTGLARRPDTRAALNTAKDIAKTLRGTLGDAKYSMHAGNRLTRCVTLRDGSRATEFIRCNPHPYGVSVGDHAAGIHEVLTREALSRLVTRQGYCILYTHLGKHVTPGKIFTDAAMAAFEALADEQGRGNLLVTTTTRLLDYHQMRRKIVISQNAPFLDVESHGQTLDGMTIYDVPEGTVLRIDGKPSLYLSNPPDHLGRTSISLPFRRLTYPL